MLSGLAQSNYDLEKINVECVEWSGPLTTVTPKILRPRKNKCRVVSPKILRPRKNKCWVVDAQKYYNLEKINVEWCAQNNYYDLEKINVEWSGTHLKIMSTRSWYKKNTLEKNRWRVEISKTARTIILDHWDECSSAQSVVKQVQYIRGT